VLEERADDIAFFEERIEKGVIAKLEAMVGAEFERMDYTEAIKVLEGTKRKFEFPVKWGMDLQSEHERFLAETHVGKPVILMNYPKEIKAFYMRLNEDGRTVAAMDVLAPGIGEIIGGSQREDRLDVLDARIAATGLDPAAYAGTATCAVRDRAARGVRPRASRHRGLVTVSRRRDVIPFPRTAGNAGTDMFESVAGMSARRALPGRQDGCREGAAGGRTSGQFRARPAFAAYYPELKKIALVRLRAAACWARSRPPRRPDSLPHVAGGLAIAVGDPAPFFAYSRACADIVVDLVASSARFAAVATRTS